MPLLEKRVRSGEVARSRLRGDQALGPLAEQRAQLEILTARLEQAGRGALMQALASRMRKDRRFAPVFGQLVRMTLKACDGESDSALGGG